MRSKRDANVPSFFFLLVIGIWTICVTLNQLRGEKEKINYNTKSRMANTVNVMQSKMFFVFDLCAYCEAFHFVHSLCFFSHRFYIANIHTNAREEKISIIPVTQRSFLFCIRNFTVNLHATAYNLTSWKS